jgi:hypothetical protein
VSTGSSPLGRAKQATRAAVDRRYGTARAYERARLASVQFGRTAPIVVLQMGKVGSRSVLASLERAVPDRPVVHAHFLSDAGLERARRVYARSWPGGRRAAHVFASEALRARRARRPDERWDVVTLVRDPVARNLSSFFQVGELQFGLDFAALRGDGADAGRLLEQLTTAFVERYDEHDVPLRWFDTELAAPLGVDVYGRPFPAEGFVVVEGPRARVLVLKTERLAECAAEAFGSFLGLDGFGLVERNVGEAKGYGDLYRAFVERVRLPEAYLERMYSSRYATHFYDGSERASFARRWRG